MLARGSGYPWARSPLDPRCQRGNPQGMRRGSCCWKARRGMKNPEREEMPTVRGGRKKSRKLLSRSYTSKKFEFLTINRAALFLHVPPNSETNLQTDTRSEQLCKNLLLDEVGNTACTKRCYALRINSDCVHLPVHSPGHQSPQPCVRFTWLQEGENSSVRHPKASGTPCIHKSPQRTSSTRW